MAMGGIGGWCESGTDGRPTYRLTRSALLRGLGVVYVSAFGSLAVQLDGLIGSRGILPAAEFLDRAGQVLGTGPATYWRLPTLFWLDASDRALHGVCWGGLGLGVLVIAGILPGPCLALLWLFYLSLTVAGQVFLGYQWDSLLLEAGLLALLLTPWCLRLDRSSDLPGPFAVWMFRWLVFRLMFQSGVVKLTSGDPVWWTWKALDYHYQTQPLPTWTSWYFHQMPAWFQALSLAFMFYAELVAPFFIFGPRILRRIGFMSLVLFQALIAATGNYGFFNLLTAILCLSLLDDRDWCRVVPGWREENRERLDRILPRTEALVMAAPGRSGCGGGNRLRGHGRADAGDSLAGGGHTGAGPGRRPVARTVADRQSVWPVSGNDHRSPRDHRRGERRWRELEAVPIPLEARRAQPPSAVRDAAHAPPRLADVVRRPRRRLPRLAVVPPSSNNASSEARPRSSHFSARTRSPTARPDTSAHTPVPLHIQPMGLERLVGQRRTRPVLPTVGVGGGQWMTGSGSGCLIPWGRRTAKVLKRRLASMLLATM